MNTPGQDSSRTQRLLEQARDGESRAADRLLNRHRPYLRRLIEVRLDPKTRSRFDTSDVLQDAEMEAIRRLQGYLERPPMPFRLWLRQIAYDRLLMLHRQHFGAARRSVEREVPLPDRSSLMLARQVLAKNSTPSQQLIKREFAQRVRQAVSLLPEIDRDVLILRQLEGLSNLETAHLLKMDPATASRRYGRAVIHLRTILLQSGLMES